MVCFFLNPPTNDPLTTDHLLTDHLLTDPSTHRPIDTIITDPTLKDLAIERYRFYRTQMLLGKQKTILRSIMYLMIEYLTLSTCKRKQFFYKRRTAGIN